MCPSSTTKTKCQLEQNCTQRCWRFAQYFIVRSFINAPSPFNDVIFSIVLNLFVVSRTRLRFHPRLISVLQFYRCSRLVESILATFSFSVFVCGAFIRSSAASSEVEVLINILDNKAKILNSSKVSELAKNFRRKILMEPLIKLNMVRTLFKSD